MSLADQLQAAAVKAVTESAEIIRGVSVSRAPIDKGTLRGSANVVTSASGDGAAATISFNTVYAAYQHEGVGFNFQDGGQAKYLESAVKDHSKDFRRLLDAYNNAVLRNFKI